MANSSSSRPERTVKHGVETTRGAIYHPVHGVREVKIYPIQEHELKTIGICNTMVTLFCSIGTFFMALIGSCLWDTVTTKEATTSAGRAFIAICAVLALAGYFAAFCFHRQKKNELGQIKSETKM